MRKALTLVLLIAAPLLSLAQGTVVLANKTGLVKQWTSFTDSTLISVPKNTGYVQMLWAPHGTPYAPWAPQVAPEVWLASNPAWSFAVNNSGAVPAPIAFSAGVFSSGTYTAASLAPPGSSIDYVMLGWTGNFSSFQEAYGAAAATGNYFVGVSDVATTPTGNPTAIPPGSAVSIQTSFPGMTLMPISPTVSYSPYYALQPVPSVQTVLSGAIVRYYAVAYGSPAPSCQWYFNQTNAIPGATNTMLILTNAHTWDSGTYRQVSSNVLGTNISYAVTLIVMDPTLDVHMAPVITLNANVGLTYNLQYLNAIGPTNAWFDLAVVTITNAAQVYVDLSAIGKPARYYRLNQMQ